MKRFSLTLLKTYRDEQLVRIRNLNHDLDKLVNGSVRPAISKPSSKSDSAAASRYYKSVRDHAMSLYGVLKEKFQAPICVCDLVHDANLQLEVRRAGIESYNQPLPPLRFKFIFSFDSSCPDKPVPWNWREIEMEQISNANDDSSDDSEHSDNGTMEIESLCSTTSSLTLVNSTASSVR